MAHANMRTLLGLAAAVACLGGAATVQAVDQPIDAERLLLRVSANGREGVLLVSRDRAIELAAPVPGETSSLELFSHSTGEHVVLPFGPPEEGGWSERDGGRRGPVLTFRVPRPGKGKQHAGGAATAAGVVQLVHRLGRHLEVMGNEVGLAPDVAHTGVGLRLTVGGTRLCALFDASTVRRARPGFLSAVGASTAGLLDCSDASLAGPLATTSTTAPPPTSSSTSTSTTTTSSTTSTTTTLPGLVVGNPIEFPGASDHSPNFLVGTRVDVPVAATVTHFGVIGKMNGPRVRLGLYRDQGGEPTTLVVGTSDMGLEPGRLEVAVPATPVAAGSYWLMAVYDSQASVGLDQSNPSNPVRFTDAFFGDGLPPFLFFSETFFGHQYNYYVRIVP